MHVILYYSSNIWWGHLKFSYYCHYYDLLSCFTALPILRFLILSAYPGYFASLSGLFPAILTLFCKLDPETIDVFNDAKWWDM